MISWNKIVEDFCNFFLSFATSSLPLRAGMQQWCLLCFKRKKKIKKWTNLPYLLKGLLYIWASECTLWFGSVLEPGCVQLAFVLAWAIFYSESRIDPSIEQIKGSVTQWGAYKVIDCPVFNDFFFYWEHRASTWLLHFWLQRVNVMKRNLLCLVAIYIAGNSSWTSYRLSLRDTPVFKL